VDPATRSSKSSEQPSGAERAHEGLRTQGILRACSFVIRGIVPVTVVQMLLVSAPLWSVALLLLLGFVGYLWRKQIERGVNMEVAMHVTLLLTFVGVLIPRIGLGGLSAPGKAWFVIVPVLAGLIGGAPAAKTYAGLGLSTLIAMAIAGPLGWLPPRVPLSPVYIDLYDAAQTALVIMVVLFLVRAFTSVQRATEDKLRIANAELAQSRDVAQAATQGEGRVSSTPAWIGISAVSPS
jgi:hypothetical protein